VTLTTTDSVNGPLSKTRLTSPADASGRTTSYSGANIPSRYSGTAEGLSSANVSTVVLTPGALTRRLYVSAQNSVRVFDTSRGNAEFPAITDGGLNFPNGVAVDATGKLYVANLNNTTVSVFDTAQGNTVLPKITGGGLDHPFGAAVGREWKAVCCELFQEQRERLRYRGRQRRAADDQRRRFGPTPRRGRRRARQTLRLKWRTLRQRERV
jgi:YVTN family beta-propeller protein